MKTLQEKCLNKDPEFIAWLGQMDEAAGKSKLDLIKQAYESFDAEKVASFFLQFINKKTKQTSDVQPRTGPYKKGEFIGQKYEVYDVLGEGGFGIVYLVYSHANKGVYALKTFRDEYLEDIKTRERFRKEAQVWIDLERHPYLVRAYFIDKISGRLYIAMEHIASDEPGMNTLSGYLRKKPPDLAQSLRWAIQFCYGMEHAYSKGIKAHRDIKPSNIMIDQNMTVKITDFGLAGVLLPSYSSKQDSTDGKSYNDSSMQTTIGTSIGTPEYMSPEQFTDLSACDERSDIYSFGIVLYQMASGGKLPFYADNPDYRWAAFKHFHQETPVPKLSSPLFSIIQRCLEKEPRQRYRNINALRSALEPLLKLETGEIIKPPELKELEAWELVNKGFSLGTLGKYQEEIACYDMALEISPILAEAWYNKGVVLGRLGKHQDAIACNDNALEINPRYAAAWNNKGFSLVKLGKYHEGIACYNKTLEINSRDEDTWYNKGVSLGKLGKYQEEIACYDMALEINPRYADALYAKAFAEDKMQNKQTASFFYKRFIEVAPAQYTDHIEYASKRLRELGQREQH